MICDPSPAGSGKRSRPAVPGASRQYASTRGGAAMFPRYLPIELENRDPVQLDALLRVEDVVTGVRLANSQPCLEGRLFVE